MSDPFIIKLCSDGAAFEVKSMQRTKLDLISVSEELASLTRMRIRVKLPVILILEGEDGQSITVYPSGRLLLRKFPSEESVRKTALEISPSLYSGKR
ncbi:MAG: hypothetical protein CW716_00090 [Candidatus Bathyarchaeum sp.]|nr:MAG: hypothetical protein CW716_00090 [Candidatus Bathyarchaeum sp.]